MANCEIPKFTSSSKEIDQILASSKTIAVIGLSPKPERPSHGIYLYLKAQGFKVFGVNPGHRTILGDTVYSSLLDVPESIDIVDVFREPSAVPEIVNQAIQKKAKTIWLQEGIIHNDAAERARLAGMNVIMNKCIYKEHRRTS